MAGMHVSVCRAIISTDNRRPTDDIRVNMHRNRFRGSRRELFHKGHILVSIGFNAHWEEPRGGFESRVLHYKERNNMFTTIAIIVGVIALVVLAIDTGSGYPPER